MISNRRVFGLYGPVVCESLVAEGFAVTHFLIGDGERYKSLKTAETALAEFARAGLTRTDIAVALGGGVVGDLAGFAASVYLRGVPFVQVPTTLLAMVDSSVGGKTGVNSAFGKNLIGAFHQPVAVAVDLRYFHARPSRITAGLCEMVKHAALRRGRVCSRTLRAASRLPGRSNEAASKGRGVSATGLTN